MRGVSADTPMDSPKIELEHFNAAMQRVTPSVSNSVRQKLLLETLPVESKWTTLHAAVTTLNVQFKKASQ